MDMLTLLVEAAANPSKRVKVSRYNASGSSSDGALWWYHSTPECISGKEGVVHALNNPHLFTVELAYQQSINFVRCSGCGGWL